MAAPSSFRAVVPLLLVASLACAPVDDPVHSFTIIQLNDVYEILPLPTRVADKYESRGGLAYVGTLVREARQRGPVLILHAGDFLSPSLLSIKYNHKGAQMIDAMNALQVDLVTFGNHEFDFGCDTLIDGIRRSTFPWVAANVALPSGLELPDGKVRPYRVLTTAGLRIGIFGLTTVLAPLRCDNGDITFQEPVSTAVAVVEELKRERVQLIIALTHLSNAEDRALASAAPDVDLIIGGHDHNVFTDLVGKTLITKAGANATSLGVIRVKATRANGELVVEKNWTQQDVNPGVIKPDAVVSKALARYVVETGSLARTIGTSEVSLDVREDIVREGESNFGNYIADLIRTETHADVAIVNSGALRGDRVIPAGPITLEDLETALVFQNRMVAIKVTGEQLVQALENGVSRAGEKDSRFPQVSGLNFAFNPDSPSGRRIRRVRIGNSPLQRDRIYTMGTIDFLTSRGDIDGYTLPADRLELYDDLKETVLRDLAKGPIRPSVDGRIISLRQP